MTAQDTLSGVPDAADQPGDERGGATATFTDDRITLAALDRLSHAFESSARRTELMVYPFLFAFIILAAYGFYLVFSLAKDVHSLSVSVETNMSLLASHMQTIASHIEEIGTDVRSMSVSTDSIARDVRTLDPMLTSMANMDRSMRDMTLNTTVMRDDMAALNRNISRPMRAMNSFMPW